MAPRADLACRRPVPKTAAVFRSRLWMSREKIFLLPIFPPGQIWRAPAHLPLAQEVYRPEHLVIDENVLL